MKHKRNVLLINYYFPPIRCVATHRIRNFYEQCLSYFNAVYVSTTTNRRTLPIEKIYDIRYPNVVENPTLDYRTFKRGGGTSFSISKNKGIGAFIFRLVESFPTNIILGEGGLLYIITSLITVNRLVKKEKIGYIFSSFRPFADHYIAYLTKRFNPGVFWIADFRDHPINQSLGNVYIPQFQRMINRHMLKGTDIVLGVSKGVLDKLPVTKKGFVLRNGISSFPAISEMERFDKFVITYTGSVYPEEQDPDSLLQALHNIIEKGIFNRSDIQFVYAGQHSSFWANKFVQYKLIEIFCDYGYLNYTDTLTIQSRSHLNLLLNYCDKGIKGDLSAKLYEYLRWPNPIVAITNGSPDIELNEIFDRTGCGMTFTSDDQKGIEKYLINLLEANRDGPYRQVRNLEEIEILRWEYNFKQLIKAINETEERIENTNTCPAHG